MSVLGKLKRRRLVRVRGGRVEIATGVIAALIAELSATEASAAERPLVSVGEEAAATVRPAAIDMDVVRTLSADELKALFTPAQLAAVGVDADEFARLLKSDVGAAIKLLDSAFRKHIDEVSSGSHAIARGALHADHGTHDHADHGEGLGGSGISPLLVLGGLALVGGGILIASSGNSSTPKITAATGDSVTTAEDSTITFDPRGNDTAAHGTLTITTINGTAIAVNGTVAITGGSIKLNADGSLTFTPTANFNGAPSFTYTVVDTQGAMASSTVNLTVTAVNDAPVNSAPASVSADQGTTVVVGGLSVADVDAGTSTFTTTLKVVSGLLTAGTVTGGATISGNGTGQLTLTGTIDQVNATLKAISYTGGASFAGSDTLTMTTSDGALSTSTNFPISVTQVLSGVVVDGYVAGSTVFIDVNGNGKLDAGEPSAVTNANGGFSIASNLKGPIVAVGGVNTDTGLANSITLVAPVGAGVISPVTTLVQALIASGLTPASAKLAVAAQLGIPAGIDVTKFDPLALTQDPALALAVQKATATVAALLVSVHDAGGASGDAAVSALVGKLAAAAAAGTSVDLTDLGTIEKLFTGLPGVTGAAIEAAALRATAAAQAIEDATSVKEIAQSVKAILTPGADLPVVTTADTVTAQVGLDFVNGKVVFDTAVTTNILANDIDPEHGSLTLVSVGGHAVGSSGSTFAIDDFTVVANPDGTVTVTSSDPAFAGFHAFEYEVRDAAGHVSTETVTLEVTAFGPAIGTDDVDVPAVVASAHDLALAGITTVDLTDNTATISEAQAATLIHEGLHFAADDSVVVTAAGTHMSTTLKGLQDLHVAAVDLHGASVLALDAGIGGLGALSVSGLPHFGVGQDPATLDVTVNVAPGAIDPTLDLTSIATALHTAGVDHIGDNGGAMSVTLAQAGQLNAAGLDFAASSDVSVVVGADGLANLNAAQLGAMHVDHIDVASNVGTITDAQASALVGAGLDFAAGDHITVEANGTHMATSLKSLQQLHVSDVFLGGSSVIVDAGIGGLGGLSSANLPHFNVGQDPSTVDITLDIGSGHLDPALSLGQLAAELHTAGIDHLSAHSAIDMTVAQADAILSGGLDFTAPSDVTVNVASADFAHVAGEIGALAAVHVDHLDVVGDTLALTDAQAASMVHAGIDFAVGDHITVEATGTHMSTTMQGLHDLHVDSIAAGGSQKLILAAGSLANLTATDVPQFDVAQSDGSLDVTLVVTDKDLGDLARLATALRDAGVDHFAYSGVDSADIRAQMSSITQASGIDFVATQPGYPVADANGGTSDGVTTLGGFYEKAYYGDLLSALSHPEELGGTMDVTDATASSLLEAGMLKAYLADTLVIDATQSGDKLASTLKSLADLNPDAVHLANLETKPVYVSLGLQGPDVTADDVRSLLNSLSQDGAFAKLFDGTDHVSLVVDESSAHALSGVDGAMQHLADMGFTEVNVLAETSGSLPDVPADAPIEVKMIAQDSELYDYLHHPK